MLVTEASMSEYKPIMTSQLGVVLDVDQPIRVLIDRVTLTGPTMVNLRRWPLWREVPGQPWYGVLSHRLLG